MEARQKVMEIIGREGCYFLCLVRIAEEITGSRIDAIAVYLFAVARKFMDQTCYLVDPCKILEHMTGQKWTVTKEDRTYKAQPGEKEVLRYERTEGRTTNAHFVLPDYDPYGDSATLRNGRMVSKRIFRRAI